MLAYLARRFDYLLLLLLALLWGSSYPLIKLAVDTIPPTTVIASRVVIAAALLGCVVVWRNHPVPQSPSRWGQLFIQSFLNSFGAWMLLAWGQQYIDSALAGTLNSTSPIFVFFITLFVTGHERSSWQKLLGVVLGLSGVVLILGSETDTTIGLELIAQLAVLAGALLYAVAAIYGRRFSDLPPTVTAFCAMLIASIVLVPIALLIDQPWQLSPSMTSLVAVLVLGVLSTALALLIYFRLLRTLGSLGVASQAYLRTVFAVLLSLTLLDETLTREIIVGITFAIVGVALIIRPVTK